MARFAHLAVFVLSVTLALLLSLSERVRAATYHVSKGGSNSNSCSSAQSPGGSAKQTIAEGAACLSGGDTLLIQAGTYEENLMGSPEGSFPWRSGSAGQYTRYARYQNDQVVIRPGGGSRVLYLNGAQYVEFDGLVFDGEHVSLTVMKLDAYQTSTEFIRLQNCELIGPPSQRDFLALGSAVAHSEFLRNHIHGSRNYCVYETGHDNLWDGNTIRDCGGYGIHGYDAYGRLQNNTVRNNSLSNVGHDGWCANYRSCTTEALLMHDGGNHRIYNNLIYNAFRGISSGSQGGVVSNNTLYQIAEDCLMLRPPSRGVQTKNNICVQSGGIHNDGSGNDVAKNLERDPGFMNPGGGDFHLSSATSPAVGYGANLSGQGVSATDKDGSARPNGAWAAGAYEYGSKGGGPVVPIGKLPAPRNLRLVFQ